MAAGQFILIPQEHNVTRYPDVPRAESQGGTKEEWDAFWLQRDLFLNNGVVVPNPEAPFQDRGYHGAPQTNEDRNRIYDEMTLRFPILHHVHTRWVLR